MKASHWQGDSENFNNENSKIELVSDHKRKDELV